VFVYVTATQRSVGDGVVRFIVTPSTGPWDVIVICHVRRGASAGEVRLLVPIGGVFKPHRSMFKSSKYLNLKQTTTYADSCVA
jgi:hypothetical protein